jgi:N-acetylmuramic acid 6-phosphate etherase
LRKPPTPSVEVIGNFAAKDVFFSPRFPHRLLSGGYNAKMPRAVRETRTTEHRLRSSRHLDRMSSLAIVRLMNREDRRVVIAVQREVPAIARSVDVIVNAIKDGGRLIYVGAGTSGRLAVLDAAECPPTFGTSPDLVQAIIAGGQRAIIAAVEGAEDSPSNAVRDLREKNLSNCDVVVGIAASGTTPYVLGAMKYARKVGAATIAVTCNREAPLSRLADIAIATTVGREILTGSTRLKAGTAQKMVLNMLSTAAMVRLGHVYENLMIDVMLTNEKLSGRALRILAEASGKDVSAAKRALRQSRHNMRVALVMLKRGIGAHEASQQLSRAQGNLQLAINTRG